MSEIDLDRLGDVWRAPPDPAELDQIRRGAEAVRRGAWMGQITDYGLAALVSAVVIALIISNPRLETALLGGAAIIAMLFNTIRQRRLREQDMKALSGSTEQMLDQTIARLTATVKRNRLSLISALPAVMIGVAFGWALDNGAGSPLLTRFSNASMTRVLVVGLIVFILVAALVHFARALGAAQAELKQHIRFRNDFRSETDPTDE